MRTAYDPWSETVLDDPYPWYDELRAGGGCHENPDLELWVLSSHELVSRALRDHRTFSSVGGVSRQAREPEGGWIGEDPPSHTETRAMGAPVFTRTSIPRHEASIRTQAQATVEAFVATGGGDAVRDLAETVSVHALCSILGVPNDNRAAMVALSEATFVDISAFDESARAKDFEALGLKVGIPISGVIEAGIDDEVADPAATVVDMVRARAGEHAGFVDLDVIGRATYVTALVTPGVETTRTMISNAVELIARYPEAWQSVRDGGVSPGGFIAEVLRFESPIQGFFRVTTEAVDAGAATIPKGARVLCLYGSANRDGAVFGDDADVFKPGRDNAGRHLAYGAGIHRCIGAWLAEAEGAATIEALAGAVGTVEVLEAVRRSDMAQLRAFRRLDVRVA